MTDPKLISSWEELAKCESDTHVLDIEVDKCSGFIYPKNLKEEDPDYYYKIYYLSTHTFYGSMYEESTKALQERGFNIIIDNWDKDDE